jgi:glycosyltransferase involved in cell wall biosynthesis
VRIAFDAKRYFNNATGLGFYSRTLVNGLRAFFPENEYLLYTPYIRGNYAQDDSGARFPEGCRGKLVHPLWRSKLITPQLKHDGVQVFHGLSHELPSGLSRAGIRSVVSMHDLIFMRYPELYPATDRFFYGWKYRKAAHEADVVVAISEQTKRDLIDYFEVPAWKIRVIGQACDPSFSKNSFAAVPGRDTIPMSSDIRVPGDGFVIAAGSLTPRKNWDGLIKALSVTRERGFDIPLVAVGTGRSDYARSLPSLAVKLGVSVIWINRHIPSHELALLYRRASALVYPSLFEGFGIPILEALTIGIPVVTSTGSCFGEVGGDAALYANPLSAEDLAEKIMQAMDSHTRDRLLREAPGQIRQFDLRNICETWNRLYTDLYGINSGL